MLCLSRAGAEQLAAELADPNKPLVSLELAGMLAVIRTCSGCANHAGIVTWRRSICTSSLGGN